MFRNLSKSQKLVVAITGIWGLISFLCASLFAANSYDDSFLVFLASFVFMTLPITLYWTGVWIWGMGYIINFVKAVIQNPIQYVKKRLSSESKYYYLSYIIFVIIGAALVDSNFIPTAQISGFFITTTIVGYIFAKGLARSIKRDNLITKLTIMSLFAGVLFYQAYYKDYIVWKESLVGAASVMKEAHDFVSGVSESPQISDTDSAFEKLVKEMIQKRIEFEAEASTLLSSLYPENFDNALTPLYLNNPSKIDQMVNHINEKIGMVYPMHEKFNLMLDGFSREAADVYNQSELKKLPNSHEFESGFYSSLNPAIEKTRKVYSIALDLVERELSLTKQMLLFFKEIQGDFEYENEIFLFKEDSQIRTFNQFSETANQIASDRNTMLNAIKDMEDTRREQARETIKKLEN